MNFSEKPKTLIFSTKERARDFVKSLDKNEIRGKLSVKKTKGWSTYSVEFRPHSYSDVVALMKVYKPEKRHYLDISKEVSRGSK